MPNRTCSVDGCERPHVGRGFCSTHYSTLIRAAGAPLSRLPHRRPQDNFCPTEDLCERGPIEGWCEVFRARVAETIRGRVTEVSPPVDPLALPVVGPCWRWDGATTKYYGTIGVGGRNRRAHRVAVVAFGRNLGSGVVDHRCRNKLCVNPDHLDVVTQRENVLRGLGQSVDQ